jgi:hypothetical protein
MTSPELCTAHGAGSDVLETACEDALPVTGCPMLPVGLRGCAWRRRLP